jgi:D-amino-acid dehydrogenase
MARTALVIGGGLLGVTSAWYLAENGFAVTLVERREGSGLETSFANGGLITPSQSDPWNGPGTLVHLLTWLWREDSPLLLRPRALPGMWRWGLKFLLNSRAAPWWRASEANLALGLYSVRCLKELREGLKLEYGCKTAGTLKVFQDEDALERAVTLARSLEPQGLRFTPLDAAGAVALEPLLDAQADHLAGAIHYPQDESGDAHAFTRALEAHARSKGVRFLYGTEVTRLRSADGMLVALETPVGDLSADVYILAAASASPALAAPLGLDLPVYPVKGYSATLDAPELKRNLNVPLVDFERKVVVTPLGKKLRVAGTAEFTGFDASLNPLRSANVLRQMLRLLPEVAEQVERGEVQHWTGLRPMTADGPPLLGATPYRNLYLNTGHGPLGFTLCAGSSRAVADLAAGHVPEIGLAPYSLARFG